ncbi:PstS family phosphate ABC transporter substrate-binding protein [Luteimonas saliphila]|uniref:PstS family phosphate ABC transporter substrate-binding protein n=1 Tax=Luteimonas saliphila TaxID=2804919 RepID=UPI00192DC4D1|nr:PstS family phosphate ABC transporter substrate-binding protein [Luteimonas saliphila]
MMRVQVRRSTPSFRPVPAILAAVLMTTGLLTTPVSTVRANETVIADGSSTVYPITREAARRFQRNQRDARIEVAFSGTTAGFRRFCAGELDIANASRPINAQEQAQCKAAGVTYRQIPVAMDAIAIVVHPGNRWVNDITVAELRRLWAPEAQGRVTTWKQVREQWPDTPVVLFGRGQDSGTYDYFTAAIVGTTRSSRSDYTASEDEELLAAGIARQRNALGFFGIGGYHRHWDELKLVAVDNGSGGGPIHPSLETVKRGEYAPLSRPVFVYVNEQSLTRKTHLQPFLRAYLTGIRQWLHFTGYMPLADEDYQEALRVIERSP